MRTEQMPHPIEAEPSQKRGGKSLDKIVTGIGQMICPRQLLSSFDYDRTN